ncbi:hypothetical protein BACCAC_01743 [Bacteroides caccae ATCC 43185]|nr:hypothetical protein BACCAC_01743 [Bacteroides caccae ATCC 43185]
MVKIMYNSLHYRMILLHSICQVLHLYSLGEEYDKSGKLHSFLIQRNE